jgi:hypothetical protein
MNNEPSSDQLTMMAKQIVLQPRKFGVVGSYARDMLHAETGQDSYAFMMDQLMVRLTTSVLSGRTISAEPEIKINYPASWWQHWKHASNAWISLKHELWMGRDAEGETTTPPPWLILLWPLLVLWPKWLARHPVRQTKLKGLVQLDQDILYPKIDMPPNAGYPVIYESISLNHIFQTMTGLDGATLEHEDLSRFMCKGEIINSVRRDSDLYGKYHGDEVWAFVDWLENHGVNIEQLVKR